MGSHDFHTSATGETARDAYRNACEQATFEHGHDPYNGTIATTSGFRTYQTPEPEPHGPIMKLIRKDLGLTQAEFGEIIGRSGGYISCHERDKNPKPLPAEEAKKIIQYARTHEPFNSYRTQGKLNEAGYRLGDFEKAVNGKMTSQQWHEVTEKILDDRRFEKWGNCACIKTGENHYTFIGWAAS